MNIPDVLVLKKKELNMEKYTSAKESDYQTLLTHSTVVYEEGEEEPRIVYLELEDEPEELTQALNTMKYQKDYRTDGMMTRSATIGFSPRVPLRRDFCTAARSSIDFPAEHALVTSYARKVAQYYNLFAPQLYQKHEEMVEKVLKDWRMGESVFTSGIINKNNPLPYHFDTGNFKNVWSNMLVFKKDIQGGYLSVPQYDIGFQLKSNSLLMFDGQNILHGVTPITMLSESAYRYSIVFYSLQQMWQCLPPKEEIQRIRDRRVGVEERSLHRENMEVPAGRVRYLKKLAEKKRLEAEEHVSDLPAE